MSEPIEKLVFETMDFKFTAAHSAYSKFFDEADEERREVLNTALTQLHSEEISYPAFYEAIDSDVDARRPFHRSRISTSRKFAYRRNERKVDRIKRHK
jgi:hypothetical protein